MPKPTKKATLFSKNLRWKLEQGRGQGRKDGRKDGDSLICVAIFRAQFFTATPV